MPRFYLDSGENLVRKIRHRSRVALKSLNVGNRRLSFQCSVKDGTVLVFLSMDGKEDTVRILVQGLDLHLGQCKTALLSFLERNGISICHELSARPEGSAIIQISSNERQSGKMWGVAFVFAYFCTVSGAHFDVLRSHIQ